MKTVIASLLILVSTNCIGQFSVRINVKTEDAKHHNDSIHLAGSFNGWNPASAQGFAVNNSGEGAIILHLDKGQYAYKFARDSWEKGEVTSSGGVVANRQLNIISDTSLDVVIQAWQDDFQSATTVRKSTASKHVVLMDSIFNIPQLNRTRGIWLYLPEGYSTSSKKYPVLYMHDGQNLFDNATSAYGEWGVDEFLDSANNKECIVVGIANGQSKRMNEYNPYAFEQFGEGEGGAYVGFIVNTLKPFIDQHYKTKPGKKNTFIAGSSMGGLISLYAVLKYPKIFGGVGIFSPAFWTASDIGADVSLLSKAVKSKLFFYAGAKESEKMVPDMQRIETLIKEHSHSKTKEEIDADAQHNEAAWQKHFPSFYMWILK